MTRYLPRKMLSLFVAIAVAVGLMPLYSVADEVVADVPSSDERAVAVQKDIGTPDVDYVDGEVLVVLADDVAGSEAEAVESAARIVAENDVVAMSDTTVEEARTAADDAALPVTLQVEDGKSVADAIVELENDPNVVFVQPNYIYELVDGDTDSDDSVMPLVDDELLPQATTNDPKLIDNTQWYLLDGAQGGIDAVDAWDTVRCEGSVTVAVMDTGIVADHEDLAANIVGGYNVFADADIPEDYRKLASDISPAGNNYHGTHVAGIISGVANNGKGIAGVSYNAGLYPIRMYNDQCKGCTSTIMARAFRHLLSDDDNDGFTVAQEYNIRVVNFSSGTTWKFNGDGSDATDDGKNDTYQDGEPYDHEDYIARHWIDKTYDAGILTVCAAGNYRSGTDSPFPVIPAKTFPGDYEKCLNVINVNNLGKRSFSSNYGEGKDISAPGSGSSPVGNIYSTFGPTDGDNPIPYQNQNGTSMASPMVAGVAALCFAANPNLTPQDVTAILESTATDLGTAGWDEETAWGRVNAAAAVQLASAYAAGDNALTVGSSSSAYRVTDDAIVDARWEVDDTSVATIDPDTGVLTGVAPGTVTVKATSATHTGLSWEKVVTVYQATIGGNAEISSKGTTTLSVSSSPTSPARWIWSVDSGSQFASVDAVTGAVSAHAPGTAVIRATLEGESKVTTTFTVTVYPAPTWKRLAGDDRYGTMGAIVDEAFDAPCDTVIVATGQNFPDALAASALAGSYDAPIVLTPTDSLDATARATIASLQAKHAIILGGTAAVSASVQADIKAMGVGTERIAGADRRATSLAVYDRVTSRAGVDTVVIACGETYADALSVSPYAYAYDAPILLTSSGRLSDDQVAAVKAAGGIGQVLLIGGTAVVPDSVKAQLGGDTAYTFTRLAGPDRYATGNAVATWEVSEGMSASNPVMATGVDFPDALAGAALAGTNNSIVALVTYDDTDTVDGVLIDNKRFIEHGYFLGGTQAISARTAQYVESACV